MKIIIKLEQNLTYSLQMKLWFRTYTLDTTCHTLHKLLALFLFLLMPVSIKAVDIYRYLFLAAFTCYLLKVLMKTVWGFVELLILVF